MYHQSAAVDDTIRIDRPLGLVGAALVAHPDPPVVLRGGAQRQEPRRIRAAAEAAHRRKCSAPWTA